MEVSQRITQLRPKKRLWIVADRYPVWLVAAVAFGLPIDLVYAPERFKKEFSEVAGVWHGSHVGLTASAPPDTLILGSGSQCFLQALCVKLENHTGGFILNLYSLDDHHTPIAAAPQKERRKLVRHAVAWGHSLDLKHVVLQHSAFGGATNGHHLVFYDSASGCSAASFAPARATPKTLRHYLSSAARGWHDEVPAPLEDAEPLRAVLWEPNLRANLWKGLLDVTAPGAKYVCPSVFSKTGFVRRELTLTEVLTALDLPSRHQSRSTVPQDILWGLPSAIVTSIFLALWGSNGGGSGRLEGRSNGTNGLRKGGTAPKITREVGGPTREKGYNREDSSNQGVDEKSPYIKKSDSDERVSECSGDAGDDEEGTLAGGRCDAAVEHVAQKAHRGTPLSSRPHVCPKGEPLAHTAAPEASINVCPATRGVGEPQGDLLLPATGGVGAGEFASRTKPEGTVSPTRDDPDGVLSDTLTAEGSSVGQSGRDKTALGKDTNDFDVTNTPTGDVLQDISDDRNNQRAVKSDNAEVNRGWWNDQVFGGSPSQEEVKAADTLREQLLHRWACNVARDCSQYMRDKHGDKWFGSDGTPMKPLRDKGGDLNELGKDLEAVSDIMWRAFNADWFEYPVGSRLHFMRFPEKYRNLARDGVPVFFEQEGPTQKRPQRDMPEDAKAVLREKLTNVIGKKYLDVPENMIESLIQYFAVPKGYEGDKVKDWRIVYHAGANGLNDCVWTPSFWLPTAATLLRMLDENSLMQDRDIGEMFLNFMLSRDARKFTGVDLRPLGLTEEECPRLWLVWVRNLMGFKSSPYGSVRTYLIAEEIIRGDPNDESNAFQWSDVRMNLPGTHGYSPSEAWISKRRKDGSLASDFATFVDDQRVVGGSHERVKEAGHAISTRESYLGIQDALRKIRHFMGSRFAGAWAGVVVINDEEKGLVQLLSQENWDKMKRIVSKWLERLERGDQELDHTELRSDRGFLVYACQAYPSLRPYLKGLHLSYWRPGAGAGIQKGINCPAFASQTRRRRKEKPRRNRDWTLKRRGRC